MMFSLFVVGCLAFGVHSAPVDGPNSGLNTTLPPIIPAEVARTYLGQLQVEEGENVPAYARSHFKTWDHVPGTHCDTREAVLIREGEDVLYKNNCEPTSGSWVSPYDGLATVNPSSLDIDHLVPLKEAWLSGARHWTDSQRESFANDLTRPQLIAVTGSVNRRKGDKDPSRFLPPLQTYQCTYVRAWIQVKHFYNLSVDEVEMEALQRVMGGCR